MSAGALLYAGTVLYLRWTIHEEHFQAASESRGGVVTVLDYGAKADGLTDDGPAFTNAFSDAWQHGVPVVIPKGTYLVNRVIAIHSGMLVRSDGAIIKHTDSGIELFSAVSADSWVLQGPLTLIGTRTEANQQANEAGLFISGGSHFIVDKLTASRFKGAGIRIVSGKASKLAARGRGNHGQFAFVSLSDNHVGLEVEDGTGAEYNLFTLLSFSGNDVATRISAGNNVISTSNIVDNANGVDLASGKNDGHGIFSASNVNHNAGFNVRSVDVLNGYTFNACHIYADKPGQGDIELTGSFGIRMNGGDVVDARIVDDAGGLNMMTDTFVGARGLDVRGANAEALRCDDLFAPAGVLRGTCGQREHGP